MKRGLAKIKVNDLTVREAYPKMVEVVLDTNVLVAALRSSLSTSYRLLQSIEERAWRPVIAPTMAFEYEAVLKRQMAETGMTAEDFDDFIEYLCSRAHLVQIYFRWRPTLPDPGDDRILEVAVRTGSPSVTFNTRDFTGTGRFGIEIITPSQLLTRIEGT